MTQQKTETCRREYRRPHLAVYGRMRDLTLNSISSNMNDRMSGAATRT